MPESGTSGTPGQAGEARYKIGDVCRIADVQPYVLRYWETEFSVLAPDRSQPGPRLYTQKELQIIEQIKRLLYEEGYTIAGAKKRLEAEASGARAAPPKEPEWELQAEPAAEPPARPSRPVKTSAETQPAFFADPSKAAKAEKPDPRLRQAVAELKEILKILGRE